MRIVIAAVGRLRKGPVRDLVQEYEGRMRWPVEWREVQERRRANSNEQKAGEAALLLQALPESGPLIALDERGDDFSSNAFAELLSTWRDDGIPTCGFAIGGADGLDESVRGRAARVIRFGRQTWPHQLVRVLLAEQLYRAQQIIAGHPYHRE